MIDAPGTKPISHSLKSVGGKALLTPDERRLFYELTHELSVLREEKRQAGYPIDQSKGDRKRKKLVYYPKLIHIFEDVLRLLP